MLAKLGKAISSRLSYAVLVATNVAVGCICIGLVALALIAKFEDTPEVRTLTCFLGIERADCPDYAKELREARAETAAALEAIRNAEAKLAELRNVQSEAQAKLDKLAELEGRFESTTFFVEHLDPSSGRTVQVGTRYQSLINPSRTPEYFCYIALRPDREGTTSNFWVRYTHGPARITRRTRTASGLSQQSLDFARSVCTPLLFGESA